jgi:hypothetical protein
MGADRILNSQPARIRHSYRPFSIAQITIDSLGRQQFRVDVTLRVELIDDGAKFSIEAISGYGIGCVLAESAYDLFLGHTHCKPWQHRPKHLARSSAVGVLMALVLWKTTA